jgi:hypothetical protein
MRGIQSAALAALLIAGLVVPAAAQSGSSVSQSDIQRLQDNVFQASNDVSQLRTRDNSRASQLQGELDDLRDEVIYLKVKLRKDPQGFTRNEYSDVRDRIDDLRTRARNDYQASLNPPPPPAPARPAAAAPRGTSGSAASAQRGAIEVPAGTEMDVRLSNTLNSGTATVEDRFEGTTLVDVNVNGRTAIPAGSIVRGVITAVEPGTRTNRTAKMTVSFDQVTVNGRAYPLRGTVTQAIEGEGIKGEAGRTAAGAGVGAIIGGILGGFKGALAGILIGGGGTIAATEGKEVELPQGSVLRVRIDSPVSIQSTR